ncbi:MAG: BamA/TamA family outer membrane protein [Ignavibacteria bacterium]|nr:BamA/TamA family outer membrane protein [Ignavibacteria bacterium]
MKLNFSFIIAVFACISILCPFEAKSQSLEASFELDKIDFIGNSSYSTVSLREIIKSQETPNWFWKFLNSFSSFGRGAVYFDSLSTESDCKILREYYTANGYFNSNVHTNYIKDSTLKKVICQFIIFEGPRSRYKSLDLHGLSSASEILSDDIYKSLHIDTTSYFSQTQIKTGIDNVLASLENNGFANAKYDSTIVVQDTLKKQAKLDVFFDTGTRFVVQEIKIDKSGEGASKVQDTLLQDIIGIKVGDIYNLEKIRMSQVRLYRTGLFSSVILRPQTFDTTTRKINLLLNGSIGMMNELSPEIIVNNQQNTFNVGLSGAFTRKNFLGAARKLSVTGSIGIQNIFHTDVNNILKTFKLNDTSVYGYFEGNIRIEQPYVFNRPVLGIVEGYYKINKDNISNKRSFGGKLSFEFELPSYTFINALTTYYNFEVVNEMFLQKGTQSSVDEALSIFGADMKSYKADDPVFPTHGYNLSFLVEEANSMSWLFNKILNTPYTGTLFYKLSATAAFYAPILGNHSHVVAMKYKIGHLQAYEGPTNRIPTTKKFTVGGSNSLRGWKARELAPIETRMVLNDLVDLAGGTFLYEGAFEYRYKINKDAGFVWFFDYGNTWLGYKKFRIDEVAVNTGWGLRIFTPFAPIRVDFGIKLYDPNNTTCVFKRPFFSDIFEFQFGIGEAF